MNAPESSFGVYVHWPFCAAKCPYCDFNSHVRDRVDQAAWRKALADEIAFYAGLTPGRTVTSIFFGGGTPSLMEPETVAAVIAAIRAHWRVAEKAEITLEANPTSVEAGRFSGFAQAGVNRVSLGVQAFNDDDLKFLGRQHDLAQAMAAIEIANAHFSRTSFDLIYARPEQSPQAWEAELRQALSLAGEHLSLYQLTIEKGTPFYTRHARGEFHVPGGDDAGVLYEQTQTILNDAGMPAYEISNHARHGRESAHNLTYWRYGDYAGIGPGAHGRLGLADRRKIGTRAHSAPEIWLERVAENGHGAHPFEDIAPMQRFSEALMMGLRLREGVPAARLSAEAGKDWRDCVDEEKLGHLVAEGYLDVNAAQLTATDAGRQRLNALLAYLL